MSGLNSTAVMQAAIDHLMTLGLFESVQGHEATSSPGSGLTADVWFGEVRPAPLNSGLAATSAILTLTARVYANANSQSPDVTETAVMGAVDALMGAYSGAFTLGGLIEMVDLLGAYGQSLTAIGGYVEVGAVPYRCITFTIPCVIDDAWPQAQ